jgi:hypothetical protein
VADLFVEGLRELRADQGGRLHGGTILAKVGSRHRLERPDEAGCVLDLLPCPIYT